MNSNRALGFACDRIRLGTPINDSQAVAAVSAGTPLGRFDDLAEMGRIPLPEHWAFIRSERRCPGARQQAVRQHDPGQVENEMEGR